MISLVEELVLLTIKDNGAVAGTAGTLGFRLSLIGACLVDLNTLGRIDVDLDTVHILSAQPVGHPALDQVLGHLVAGPARSPSAWIRDLADTSREVVGGAIEALTGRGILAQEESRFLWVLKTRRYPVIDGTEQTEAKLRIVQILLGQDVPTPHDSVLIGLAHVGRLLDGFLSSSEIARLDDRVKEVGNLDLIARSVEVALREEQELIAQSFMVPRY